MKISVMLFPYHGAMDQDLYTPENLVKTFHDAGAVAIELMTFLGAPVSTTQVMNTSIMGAGSARNKKGVKWGMAGTIVQSWFITLPITMVLGGACSFLVGLFF